MRYKLGDVLQIVSDEPPPPEQTSDHRELTSPIQGSDQFEYKYTQAMQTVDNMPLAEKTPLPGTCFSIPLPRNPSSTSNIVDEIKAIELLHRRTG